MNWLLGAIRDLIKELRRRRVIRVAIVYAGSGMVILQLANMLVEPFGLPPWTLRLIVLVLLLGFPLAVGLAWVFDITEEGLVRTQPVDVRREGVGAEHGDVTSAAVTVAILVVLVVGAAWFGWQTVVAPQAEGNTATATGGVSPDPEANLNPAKIAVLYFDDHSPGDTLTAFTDGFTEHLIHRLTQVEGLEVISRHGVKPYRVGSAPLDSIARHLGAGSLVEGSVEQVGDSLAVYVQLIDGASQSHLMSERIQRPADEVFALQNDLVEEVAHLLRKRLGQEVQLESWRAGTDQPKAWRLVQRADRLRAEADQLKREGKGDVARELLRQAESLLAEAESIDPDWSGPAVLRARLATVRVDPYGHRWGKREREIARTGIRYADEALARDSTNAEARTLRGQLQFWLYQEMDDQEAAQELLERAEADLRSAIRQAPSSAEAMYTLSRLLVEVRADFEEAHYYARRAQRTDAYLQVSSHWHYQLFYSALNAGEFEQATHWCKNGQRRYPDLPQFWDCELALLATSGAATPDVARAWSLLEEIGDRSNPERRGLYEMVARPQVAAVLARAGHADSARAVLQETLRDGGDPHPAVAYYQAHTYLLLGEKEKAVDFLMRSIERNPQYATMAARDIWFESLHDHPRFKMAVLK